MKDLKIKVCGMKDPENMLALEMLAPDYMGLIFYDKSPRFFDAALEQDRFKMKRTGVFVDASEEFILEKARNYGLDALQLHGNESPEFCLHLKKRLSEENKQPEVIKVFSIKEEFNFDVLQPYENVVDYFLFDTKGKNKGGNGISFNWEVLKKYPSTTRFFLSGGIGLEEVSAIKELQRFFQKENKEELFYAVDLNSRFETAPGQKDTDRLKIFRDRLRS